MATSPACVPEMLELWARKKGIGLLGTGDFTHAAWRRELKEKLVPAEEGLYCIRPQFRLEGQLALGAREPRFVVSGEVSCIYRKNGRGRRVHHLILLPGLEEAELLSRRLEDWGGNLSADGRPILGLDSKELLEMALEVSQEVLLIPAHIWTPHFSLLGARSGFDSIWECFEDLTPYVYAVETGLSSDPAMNWRLSMLDSFALISNSDAHSPANLGREACVFEELSCYADLFEGLRRPESNKLRATIEFFPEEGKYYCDGHRNCGVCMHPMQAEEAGGSCPSCGRKLTLGVLHRIQMLADRREGYVPPFARPFERLVPLGEVIAACMGQARVGVRARRQYEALLEALGPELWILREAPLEEIQRVGGERLAQGVRRLRSGQIDIVPGYDGEYGKIRLFD